MPSQEEDTSNLVCSTLLDVAQKNITNDRVLVAALEVMSFLFDIGIMQRSNIKYNFSLPFARIELNVHASGFAGSIS
jgi:hypothetical protein